MVFVDFRGLGLRDNFLLVFKNSNVRFTNVLELLLNNVFITVIKKTCSYSVHNDIYIKQADIFTFVFLNTCQ